MLILSLDIGGTNTRAGLINSKGILLQYTLPTPKNNSKYLLKQCVLISEKLILSSKNGVKAISIGCAGPVKNGVMQGSKPMQITKSINFIKHLGNKFNLPIYLANDLQMATRAEMFYGHGKNINNFVLVSLSTGIGVGAVIDNRVIERRIEVGHSIIETNTKIAKPCISGHSGCWVAEASGSAIEKYLNKTGNKNKIKNFFLNPDNNFIKKIKTANLCGFINIINAYDPEKIIVMGSLGLSQFKKIIPTRKELEKNSIIKPIPQILKSKLGDNIGLYGAYIYAKENLRIKNV